MKYTLKEITEKDYIIGKVFRGIEGRKNRILEFTHSNEFTSIKTDDYREIYDSEGRVIETIKKDFKRNYTYDNNDSFYKVIMTTRYSDKTVNTVKTYDPNKSEFQTSIVSNGKISKTTKTFNVFGNIDINITNDSNMIVKHNTQTIYDDKNRITTILSNNSYTNIYYNDDSDIPCLLIHNGQIIENIDKKSIRNTIRKLMISDSSIYRRLNNKYYEIIDENGLVIDRIRISDKYGNVFLNDHVVQIDLCHDKILPELYITIEDNIVTKSVMKYNMKEMDPMYIIINTHIIL